MTPPPDAPGDRRRLVKVLALVALGLVALCGVAGTCLLAVSFFFPQ